MSELIAVSSIIGRLKYSCKYPSCKTSYYTNTKNHINKKFYRFPRDPVSLQAWKNACKLSPTKRCLNFRVCEDHFEISDFANPNDPTRLNRGTFPHSPIKSQELLSTNVDSSHNYLTDNNSSIVVKPRVLFSVDDSPTAFSEIGPLNEVINNNNETVLSPSCSYEINHSLITTDHSYHLQPLSQNISNCSKMATDQFDKYSFLLENKKGILTKAGLSKKDLTQQEEIMYREHRNVTSKLAKLRTLLKNERAHVNSLRNLYNEGRFEFIEESLNEVSKHFINSQLRNVGRPPNGRRWTVSDKAFALSIYKRSPRLYRYLRAYFQLPSIRTLKDVLSSIPFECGMIKPVLEHLKLQTENMDELDRCCTLIFDEVSLSRGFYYESHQQKICGFEDLGILGRNENAANHALVFMVRGIKKNYKMPVAFFFTKDTIKTSALKDLIIDAIKQLQGIGLSIVATVCDQGATNRAAITALTREQTDDRPSPYHFVVNGERIYTIFDVPHLLKNTRNALLNCHIQFDTNKFAKFEHMQAAFNIDQSKRKYKLLHKLKDSHFNFKDSYLKMKVKVAVQQLSQTMAAAIETFHATGDLPAESLYTAEFVAMVDNLFDSLNGSNLYSPDGKRFKCALSDSSPHLDFWSDILPKIQKWKIIDSKTGQPHLNFKFLEGWLVSIRAIMHLWRDLKAKGLKFLSLRNLNQDPLENFFGQIRQHGICNTNPTCHQFVAALKTVVVNNFGAPLSRGNNCEEDYCKSLGDFSSFLQNYSRVENDLNNSDKDIGLDIDLNVDDDFDENNQATAYVAGYILKKINVPHCVTCKENLFSENITEKHLYLTFKEYDEKTRLLYASDHVIKLIDTIHHGLYKFLDSNGHITELENIFKQKYIDVLNSFQFCHEHNCQLEIIDKCIRLVIYKYLREKKGFKRVSEGHFKKVKKFKAM